MQDKPPTLAKGVGKKTEGTLDGNTRHSRR
jgi:hypothetical protein